MVLLGFAFNYLAMLALCLAMPRHHKLLLQKEPAVGRKHLLRGLAIGALVVALALCVRELGGEIGTLIWFCLLMLAGWVLVGLLAWRARWVFRLAAVLPVVGGALLAL